MSRRVSSNPEVNMFPFLSVLCSVIGVLMLFMLMIIGSRVIGQQTAPPPPGPPPPPPPPVEPREPGVSQEDYDRWDEQIQRQLAILNERQHELRNLKKTVEKLQDLIETKEDENLVPNYGEGRMMGVQINKPEDVLFEPGEDVRVTETPCFVEVKANGYTMHPNRYNEKRETFAVDEIDATRSRLKSFLVGIHRNRKREYLLFLIHPNGVPAYNKIHDYLLEKYPHKEHQGSLSEVGMGAEPFSEGWLLVSEQLKSR